MNRILILAVVIALSACSSSTADIDKRNDKPVAAAYVDPFDHPSTAVPAPEASGPWEEYESAATSTTYPPCLSWKLQKDEEWRAQWMTFGESGERNAFISDGKRVIAFVNSVEILCNKKPTASAKSVFDGAERIAAHLTGWRLDPMFSAIDGGMTEEEALRRYSRADGPRLETGPSHDAKAIAGAIDRGTAQQARAARDAAYDRRIEGAP